MLSLAAGSGRVTGRVIDAATSQPIVGATVSIEGTRLSTQTDHDGRYTLSNVPAGEVTVRVTSQVAAATRQRVTVTAGQTVRLDLHISTLAKTPVVPESAAERDELKRQTNEGRSRADMRPLTLGNQPSSMPALKSLGRCEEQVFFCPSPGFESYGTIDENGWFSAMQTPLSTFSVDVDAASYGNVRRFLNQGTLPPADAVRIEELINYFDYDYPNPRGRHPFSITTEVATSPWNARTRLVHIGLQGKRVDVDELPPSNLVFLIDVSGSMNQPNKLPLLKSSFRMLVDHLRDEDRVAIVVYAGAAGLVLPSTSGDDKETILCAIDRLEAGGSTAGGAGIQLAYHVAQRSFLRGGNNRIILATDGDFNVGMSSDGDMERLIEEKRRSGVFLTVLGFGQGNLKDSKMEIIADKGNGHYAYIDNIHEARKVLVNEMGATLLTIAKDVKLQVEFNPALVSQYRLIGYENRLMPDRDFDDDTKDAGEIGAGHSVTALYEVTLTGDDRVRPFKYQERATRPDNRHGYELLTVSFRYKQPDASESELLAVPVRDRDTRFADASETFRFSAAVAEFGMILRNSPEVRDVTLRDVIATARAARGEDNHGYRAEFIGLAETAAALGAPAVGVR
jgi:Ca-activated chloride channel family protein